eukprot:746034-Hanusia_phi.AAC.4
MDLDVKGTTSQQKLNSNLLAQVCILVHLLPPLLVASSQSRLFANSSLDAAAVSRHGPGTHH